MPPIAPIALTEQNDDVMAVDGSIYHGEYNIFVSPGRAGIDNSILANHLLGFPSPSDSDASAIQQRRIDCERGQYPWYTALTPRNCDHGPL